ncbi:septum formation protein Maf [Candidatus Saccharibacteria bacterium]|nr:MAG: septum formation protein Maf [Candidatus Saccharibacteria bacterium]
MRQIILASGSPRRKELMEKMGLNFVIIPSEFDEYLDESRSVEEIAMELGLGKARSVAAIYPEAIVIGCDTIVTVGDVQLGKPTDIEDARRMWRLITSAPNKVTSSLAVICRAENYEKVTYDNAWVYLKPYNQTLVEAYLAMGDYVDKAGAYGIQHISTMLDHIEGSEDTILGLPVKMLAEILQKNFGSLEG